MAEATADLRKSMAAGGAGFATTAARAEEQEQEIRRERVMRP